MASYNNKILGSSYIPKYSKNYYELLLNSKMDDLWMQRDLIIEHFKKNL